MATLESLPDVERVLVSLRDHGYAQRMQRRPGQKEERFEQLLGGEAAPAPPATAAPSADGALAARVDALEAEVATLREELAALRSEPAV